MAKISLRVNGKTQIVDAEPEMPLLYALRNDLQLNGPKFGCGLAQCGACTVNSGDTILIFLDDERAPQIRFTHGANF